jgi:ribonuclease J
VAEAEEEGLLPPLHRNHRRLKLDEVGLPKDQIVIVEPRPATVEVGPFKVQFVPVSHSIPESSGW